MVVIKGRGEESTLRERERQPSVPEVENGTRNHSVRFSSFQHDSNHSMNLEYSVCMVCMVE